MSQVTGVEYENRQNVTKSLKIAQKIEISAHTVARCEVSEHATHRSSPHGPCEPSARVTGRARTYATDLPEWDFMLPEAASERDHRSPHIRIVSPAIRTRSCTIVTRIRPVRHDLRHDLAHPTNSRGPRSDLSRYSATANTRTSPRFRSRTLSHTGRTCRVLDADPSDEAEDIPTQPFPHFTRRIDKPRGDHPSLPLPEHPSTHRRYYQPCLELQTYSEVVRSHSASRAPRDDWSPQQRRPFSRHICTPKRPMTSPAPWKHLRTAWRLWKLSTFRPAEVVFGVFPPLPVPFSAQSKGVLPAFPDFVPLVHPPPRPLPEAGHTSCIRSFIGVSSLTPPSAGSLLTGPGVTIPGFLD
ncbi:hypothetical protein DFH08DRAFT_978570 [Mycena albidolilacea]|uniref:Uncharacterized protein n=1 Tax=Mycena albidolilacea TaxID=1033008 RepID=A0AAD6YYD6_9AGAR|nr:hypothetical protein DFH08DRAFT_978570 [Mycena albidolilacea]